MAGNDFREIFRKDFDVEKDDYDRLKDLYGNQKRSKGFTNKATMKKFEFDYEEDAYEPEKSK